MQEEVVPHPCRGSGSCNGKGGAQRRPAQTNWGLGGHCLSAGVVKRGRLGLPLARAGTKSISVLVFLFARTVWTLLLIVKFADRKVSRYGRTYRSSACNTGGVHALTSKIEIARANPFQRTASWGLSWFLCKRLQPLQLGRSGQNGGRPQILRAGVTLHLFFLYCLFL